MRIKILLPCLIFMGALASCSKWIDVKPTDRLGEGPLFETRQGFLKALNGVYVELAGTTLYGQNLTASVVDVMGQYYFLPNSTTSYHTFATFGFTAAGNKSTFDFIWRKAYEVIVNCNVIIEKATDNNGVLKAPFDGIIKGEALAARALLHLDLLRLYGPIWSEENKSKLTIPYTTTSSMEVTPLLSAEVVMDKILEDLAQARDLLQTADPIITEGVRNVDNKDGSNDLHFRQYRLNYYAVKALMVRAYMWKGDMPAALTLSKEIIDEVQKPVNPIFPFVTEGAATNATKPDRLFSSEVMFGAYNINRVQMYNSLFAVDLPQFARLNVNAMNDDKSRINEWYDDANDYRLRFWESVVNTSGTTVLTNQKYKDYADAPGRYMISVMRLGEVYLTAAECATDLLEGTAFLNKVRNSRKAFSVTPASLADLKTAVHKEFKRELLGEGQLFFLYKRMALTSLPNHSTVTGNKVMVATNYVVPLPDSEISLRNN